MGIEWGTLSSTGGVFFCLLYTAEPSHKRDARQQSRILQNALLIHREEFPIKGDPQNHTSPPSFPNTYLQDHPQCSFSKGSSLVFVSLLPNFSRVLGLKNFAPAHETFLFYPIPRKVQGRVFLPFHKERTREHPYGEK